MSAYNVFLTKSAQKEFNSLSTKVQERVKDILKLLEINPLSELLQVKKLKGQENLYRTRSGDYKVIYEVKKNEVQVIVIKVGHRREVYKKL